MRKKEDHWKRINLFLLEDIFSNKCRVFHLYFASWKYQWNSHQKSLAVNSWKGVDIDRDHPVDGFYPNTFLWMEFDHDLNYPEVEIRQNCDYFKSPLKSKTLNVVIRPGNDRGERKVFMWSPKDGNKKAQELLNCIEYALSYWNPGAERGFFHCDGALRTYALYKYYAIKAHPQNPHREFRSICASTGAVGHTRLEADGIGRQSRKCWGTKENFKTCSDRVDFLNEHSNIEAVQMTEFWTFKVDTLFLDTADWVDEHGDPILIKAVPALSYHFGESLVWDEIKGEFVWKSHPNEVYCRVHTDPKVPYRKVKIFAKELTASDFLFKGPLAPKPAVNRDRLSDTLDLLKYIPNSQETIRYYSSAKTTDEDPVMTSSLKPHNAFNIMTKITRINQLQSRLKTGIYTQLIEPFGMDAERCESDPNHSVHVIATSLTCSQLNDELRVHSLKISGLKQQKIDRLQRHYERHHPDHCNDDNSDYASSDPDDDS